MNKSEKIQIDIYNALGIMVSTKEINHSQGSHLLINNFNLENGQYYINIIDESGISIGIKKLLVLK